MWNGLFFGLVNLFTPQATLPDVASFQQQIQQFSKVYSINTRRIHVRESVMNNPSPFLTNSGVKACTLHINQHAEAKRVWSHFLNSGQEGSDPAFLAFTSAHELTHCMMAEAGKRPTTRKALEDHLGYTFKNNTHFEETLADLVGLAYVQKTMPDYYEVVYTRVKGIRQDFSNRDPDHDSSRALNTDAVAFVDSMFSTANPLRLAELAGQEKIVGN